MRYDALLLCNRTSPAPFHATVNRNTRVVVLAPKHHSKRPVAQQVSHLTTRRLSRHTSALFVEESSRYKRVSTRRTRQAPAQTTSASFSRSSTTLRRYLSLASLKYTATHTYGDTMGNEALTSVEKSPPRPSLQEAEKGHVVKLEFCSRC
jgi:hypothetical protein